VKKALAQRRSVLETEPRSAVAQAYRALAHRLVEEVADGGQA